MSYNFMRLIVFFDLPVETKKQVRVYTKFRKFLIRNGYLMIQYSVYSKILNNNDSAMKHMNIVERECPEEGHIRLLLLTEKQYSRMKVVIGGRSRTEEKISVDAFVHL